MRLQKKVSFGSERTSKFKFPEKNFRKKKECIASASRSHPAVCRVAFSAIDPADPVVDHVRRLVDLAVVVATVIAVRHLADLVAVPADPGRCAVNR